MADWGLYLRIAETIAQRFGGAFGRLPRGILATYWLLDQFYLDIRVKGHTLTLHREHYLGISLFSSRPESDALVREVADALEEGPLEREAGPLVLAAFGVARGAPASKRKRRRRG